MRAARLPAGTVVPAAGGDYPPRRRPVLRLAPRSTVCPACETDTELGPCPDGCPLGGRDQARQD